MILSWHDNRHCSEITVAYYVVKYNVQLNVDSGWQGPSKLLGYQPWCMCGTCYQIKITIYFKIIPLRCLLFPISWFDRVIACWSYVEMHFTSARHFSFIDSTLNSVYSDRISKYSVVCEITMLFMNKSKMTFQILS